MPRFYPRRDFISAHNAYPGGYWLSRVRPNAPFVITCHGKDISPLEYGFRNTHGAERQVRQALQAAHSVIVLSSDAEKTILELGARPSNVAKIPNGVDLTRFRTKAKTDIRASLGISSTAMLVLSVASHNSNKDPEGGLEAFARAARRNPALHYLVAGLNSDRLADRVGELGVRDAITLSNGLYDDDLVAAYQQCDLFFSSSINETLPLVILEAMAAGAPVLATDIGGSRDLIRDGLNGVLVPARGFDEMAGAICDLIDDRGRARGFARRAAEDVELYSWDSVGRRYLELVER